MTRQLVAEWHAHETTISYPHVGAARLIMGCPLWGEPYVSRFLQWTLPSILASREALDHRGWEIVLYVDPLAWWRLSPILHAARIPVSFRALPPMIMDVLSQGGIAKYWVLTAVHNLLVHEAGQLGAGFHMLVADIAYSNHYFTNMLRLGEQHEGIAQTGLTISFAGAGPLLERYREPDGTLRVPARDVGQIGWENVVGEWGSWSMDGIEDPAKEMPNAHFIFWRGPDSVRIHSAHQSPIWLSPSRCAGAGTALGGTLDSELPRYAGHDCYIPEMGDDMAYVALDDGRSQPTPRINFASFKRSFLDLIDRRQDFMGIFRRPCMVPARPMGGLPSDDDIECRFQRLMALIEEP